MKIEVDVEKIVSSNLGNVIGNSDIMIEKINELFESEEIQIIFKKKLKTMLEDFLSSDEGKNILFEKIKDQVEDYDLSYNENIQTEIGNAIVNMIRKSSI